LFNSDGIAASFDTRSDNKGPEVEGVAVGIINGVLYAFTGSACTEIYLCMTLNPAKPIFKQYPNDPDRAVEGVLFVTAVTGKPLVVHLQK
jgi:hypothetical protein